MEIKLNDVYNFWYNEEWRRKNFDPNWCFDGQLIVKQNSKDEFYLEDTYWDSSESKTFTLKQALERGELTFVCNLEDVEKISERDLVYYANKDLFDLSRQHRCYQRFYKRKGAEKSATKMEQVLKSKFQEIEADIEWKSKELKWTKEKLEKLQRGDMNICI